jgi:transcriptional regulator with XRE-family HTH domain
MFWEQEYIRSVTPSTTNMTDKLRFVERLVALRNGRSKADFARFLGLPAPVYQRYEEGRIPSADNLTVIATKCAVSVDYLLGRAEASGWPDIGSQPSTVHETPPPYGSQTEIRVVLKLLDDDTLRGTCVKAINSGAYRIASEITNELAERTESRKTGHEITRGTKTP